MLVGVLTFIHVVVCLILIAVVLLQSGKAADLAGAFGGMGSQTAFGPRGAATLLSKVTTGAAIIFMITSLTLTMISAKRGRTGSSVLDKTSTSTSKPADTKPAAPAQTPSTPPKQ
jgi:preprotein translocase subunit SecG